MWSPMSAHLRFDLKLNKKFFNIPLMLNLIWQMTLCLNCRRMKIWNRISNKWLWLLSFMTVKGTCSHIELREKEGWESSESCEKHNWRIRILERGVWENVHCQWPSAITSHNAGNEQNRCGHHPIIVRVRDMMDGDSVLSVQKLIKIRTRTIPFLQKQKMK